MDDVLTVEVFSVESETPVELTLELYERYMEAGLGKMLDFQSGKAVINPFPVMRKSDENMWSMICPTRSKLEDYNREVVPVRVLEVIELVQKNDLFEELSIWYDEQAPDPILVGTKTLDSQYPHTKTRYLLARWSNELRPLSEIREEAKQRWLRKHRHDLTVKRDKVVTALASIELHAEAFLDGDSLPYGYI